MFLHKYIVLLILQQFITVVYFNEPVLMVLHQGRFFSSKHGEKSNTTIDIIILPRWIHVLSMLNVGILNHYHNCFVNYYCPVHVQVLYMSHVVKMWKEQVQSRIYFNFRAK